MNASESSASSQSISSPSKQKKVDKVNRMGTAPIYRLLLEFAIPSILGMLVNGAYNLIDSIFLGQGVGPLGLSAVTVATPIMTVFLALALLVGNGGNALAALRMGEGKREEAEKTLGNVVLLCFIVSAVMAALALSPAVELLLTISSCTDEVRPLAKTFIQIVSCGFVFQMLGMSVNNFIRTAGAPNRALSTMLIGAISCTIFNYLFVILWGWGIAGSAYATVLGQLFSCAAVMHFFIFDKKSPLRLRWRYIAPQLKLIGKISSLGTASFVVQIGFAVVNLVTNYLLVVWGSQSPIGADAALASIGVVQRLAMFTVMPLIGISIALQPLLGFNYGARLFGRVRQALVAGVVAVTILGTVMWLGIHIWPDQIVSAFGIHDDHLRDFTAFALRVNLFDLPLIGFQIVCSNYFQATGQPLKSILLALTRQIVFLLPLLFVLPYVLPLVIPSLTGLDAIYFAGPLADGLSIFVTALAIFWEMRRIKNLERAETQAHVPAMA